MLTEKYTNFIDRLSTNLISFYEEATNQKYDPKDMNSIIGVVNFLNGNVIYLDGMYSKYNTDEILLSKEDGFTIIIDKEYREKQFEKTEVSIKKMIFRMVFMYIDEFITNKGKISSNVIIYPQNSDINLEELLKDILGIKEEKIRVKIEESTEEPKKLILKPKNIKH